MAHEPTMLKVAVNCLGQHIKFYEHPTQGDEGIILGVIKKVAFETDFLDTDDFYPASDYLPVLLPSGNVACQFEI